MAKKKTFVVTKTYPVLTKTIEVKAYDEDEAIELAQEIDDSEWEDDQFIEYYDLEYFAYLVDR